MAEHEPSEEAIRKYQSGLVDRRSFLRMVGVVGIGTLAAGRLLAACSPAAEAPTGTPETEPTNGEEPAAGPRSGGRFIEGYDRDVNPLDPIRTPWADPGMNAVYEPVVVRDFEGAIVPFLAASFSADEDAWRLEIPSGRTFQSGAAVTPEVIQEAFQTMRNPDTGQNAIFWAAVSDIVVDGDQVLVMLEHPSRAVGELLSTEFTYIPNLDRRAEVGEEAFGAEEADGSGPFRLVEFSPGTRVLVERWDGYDGSGAPFFENQGPAHLDEIEWVPILEPSLRSAEIETGSVHAIKNPVAADVPQLEDNEDLVVVEFQEPSNFVLIPKVAREDLGFDDVRVRQAISHAIDREGIVGSVFAGRAAATYGPVFPGWRYYEPEVEQFNQFDPERAEQLLSEAGWELNGNGVREKDGNTIEFDAVHQSDPLENQVMVAIASMLADVGISMQVRSLEPAAFREQRGDAAAFGQKWLWSSPLDVVELFVGGWQENDHPDVARSLESFGGWNRATSEDDLAEGASEAQVTFAELLPMVPVYTPNTVWAHHRRVHGWRPNQANLYPFYNDVWLEDA